MKNKITVLILGVAASCIFTACDTVEETPVTTTTTSTHSTRTVAPAATSRTTVVY